MTWLTPKFELLDLTELLDRGSRSIGCDGINCCW